MITFTTYNNQNSIKSNINSIPSSVRVDYVDLMKGLTILWIIWIHAKGHPDFGNFRNPIFFFASGIFFKISDAKTFFSKRVWLIVIPFIFFYIMAIPFRLILELWDYHTLSQFNWMRLLDLFKFESNHDYLSLYVPLWFLETLLMIQIFSFVLMRFNRFIIFALACLSLIFFEYIFNIRSLFMMNAACAWFGYFALGFLFGKPLIRFLNSVKRKTFVFLLTLAIVILCGWFEYLELSDYYNLVEKTKLIMFIICFMTFFSFFDSIKQLNFLRFFGKNSLIVLGAHLWILIPLSRFSFRIFRFYNSYTGFACALITAMILIPIIKWMNKNIPLLVGTRS